MPLPFQTKLCMHMERSVFGQKIYKPGDKWFGITEVEVEVPRLSLPLVSSVCFRLELDKRGMSYEVQNFSIVKLLALLSSLLS